MISDDNSYILTLASQYKTESRWIRAVLRLKELGLLLSPSQDIDLLIKEIQHNTDKECRNDIKEVLYNHFWPQISKLIVAGFPDWYRTRLAEALNDRE